MQAKSVRSLSFLLNHPIFCYICLTPFKIHSAGLLIKGVLKEGSYEWGQDETFNIDSFISCSVSVELRSACEDDR